MELSQTGEAPVWTLADRLRKAREHAGLRQQELADQIGISRASVVNYETGKHEPNRPTLLSWALACGVDLDWLRGPPTIGGDMVSQRRRIRKPGRSSPRVRPLHRAVAAATTLAAAVVGTGAAS